MPEDLSSKTLTHCAVYLIRVYSGQMELDSEIFCQSTLVLLNWLGGNKVKGRGNLKMSAKHQTSDRIPPVVFIRSPDAQGSPLKSDAAAEILQGIIDMLLTRPQRSFNKTETSSIKETHPVSDSRVVAPGGEDLRARAQSRHPARHGISSSANPWAKRKATSSC